MKENLPRTTNLPFAKRLGLGAGPRQSVLFSNHVNGKGGRRLDGGLHCHFHKSRPFFFIACPSNFHRSSHLSTVSLVSEDRPIAFKKSSGVLIPRDSSKRNKFYVSKPQAERGNEVSVPPLARGTGRVAATFTRLRTDPVEQEKEPNTLRHRAHRASDIWRSYWMSSREQNVGRGPDLQSSDGSRAST